MAEERYDVSRQALGLARLVDRACRRPGRYLLILEVREARRPWAVEVALLELLRRQEVGRTSSER